MVCSAYRQITRTSARTSGLGSLPQPGLTPQRRHDGRQDAGADDDVERHQEVDRLPARHVQPDPERQGRDHEQRQQDRPAQHRGGADGQDQDPADDHARRTPDGARGGSGCRPSPGRRSAPAARAPPAPGRRPAGGRRTRGTRAERAPAAARQPMTSSASLTMAPPRDAMVTCSPEIGTRSSALERQLHPVDPGRHRLAGEHRLPSQSKQWPRPWAGPARCRCPSGAAPMRVPGPTCRRRSPPRPARCRRG